MGKARTTPPITAMKLGERRCHILKESTEKEEQVAVGAIECSLGVKVTWDCWMITNKGCWVCLKLSRENWDGDINLVTLSVTMHVVGVNVVAQTP